MGWASKHIHYAYAWTAVKFFAMEKCWDDALHVKMFLWRRLKLWKDRINVGKTGWWINNNIHLTIPVFQSINGWFEKDYFIISEVERKTTFYHSFDVSSISIYLHHLFPILFTEPGVGWETQVEFHKYCILSYQASHPSRRKIKSYGLKNIINKTAISCIMKMLLEIHFLFISKFHIPATDDSWQRAGESIFQVSRLSVNFHLIPLFQLKHFYSSDAQTHARCSLFFSATENFHSTHFRQLQHFNPQTGCCCWWWLAWLRWKKEAESKGLRAFNYFS